MLEEAWAWGFDIDLWRAHLNCVTWPEVLRQMAILWGLGPKRPKPRRRETRPKMGTDGEDLVADEAGGLRLRLPPRLGIGTVKAAAWQARPLLDPSSPNHILMRKTLPSETTELFRSGLIQFFSHSSGRRLEQFRLESLAGWNALQLVASFLRSRARGH